MTDPSQRQAVTAAAAHGAPSKVSGVTGAGVHRSPAYELQLNRQDREIGSLQAQVRKLEAQYANLSADLQQLRREKTTMPSKEPITSATEIAYFKPRIESGEIDGDVYRDGSVWVDIDTLLAYRMTKAEA